MDIDLELEKVDLFNALRSSSIIFSYLVLIVSRVIVIDSFLGGFLLLLFLLPLLTELVLLEDG